RLGSTGVLLRDVCPFWSCRPVLRFQWSRNGTTPRLPGHHCARLYWVWLDLSDAEPPDQEPDHSRGDCSGMGNLQPGFAFFGAALSRDLLPAAALPGLHSIRWADGT